VVQFDAVLLPEHQDLTVLATAINAALPEDLRIVRLDEVQDKKFSAMDCLWKRYVYTISSTADCAAWRHVNARKVVGDKSPPRPDPIGPGQLDLSAMNKAAGLLLGFNDFAAFQSKGGRASTERTLHRCQCQRDETGNVTIVMEGSGFLYNMCRILAGTLVEVGCVARPAADIPRILASKDRQQAGSTLPAEGLSLEHVEYDAAWGVET